MLHSYVGLTLSPSASETLAEQDKALFTVTLLLGLITAGELEAHG